MMRLHVHVAVDDVGTARAFYETLFGAAPVVAKADYAKWMIDDPRVNFAISARGRERGVDHFGIQVEAAHELDAVAGRLKEAGIAVHSEGEARCCYARSTKAWTVDPAGIAWEAFQTHEQTETFDGGQAAPVPRAVETAPVAACGQGAIGAQAGQCC